MQINEIVNRIGIHLQVYENIGKNPPPFRITVQECKQLLKSLENTGILARHDLGWDDLTYYMGVDLEIVVKIN
jgi:hypothetical protein